MKTRILIFSPLLLLAACKKEAPATSSTLPPPAPKAAPVAVEVPEIEPRTPPAPLRDAHLAPPGEAPAGLPPAPPPPVAQEVPEDLPPEVDEDEPEPRTPGEHLDHAIQKTDQGLRKAADATGRFLERAGDKIEEKAREKSAPPPPSRE